MSERSFTHESRHIVWTQPGSPDRAVFQGSLFCYRGPGVDLHWGEGQQMNIQEQYSSWEDAEKRLHGLAQHLYPGSCAEMVRDWRHWKRSLEDVPGAPRGSRLLGRVDYGTLPGSERRLYCWDLSVEGRRNRGAVGFNVGLRGVQQERDLCWLAVSRAENHLMEVFESVMGLMKDRPEAGGVGS